MGNECLPDDQLEYDSGVHLHWSSSATTAENLISRGFTDVILICASKLSACGHPEIVFYCYIQSRFMQALSFQDLGYHLRPAIA